MHGTPAVELLVAPPLFLSNGRIVRKYLVDGFLQSDDSCRSINRPKKPATDFWLTGFDEAKESIVGILVTVPAPDPQIELIVLDGNNSAPILCDRIQGIEPFLFEAAREKLRYTLAVSPGVDFVRLAVVWRKSVRTKLDVGLHLGCC